MIQVKATRHPNPQGRAYTPISRDEDLEMDEMRLGQDVRDELDFEPSIDAAHLTVTVASGVVTLGGHVPNYAQTSLAERAVLRVKGVRGVIAKAVQVVPDLSGPVSDDDIAHRALTLLDLNVLIPAGAIKVKVSRGWISLSGEVVWQFQRVAAVEDLRKLRGVMGIRDAIDITPQTMAADVAQRIQDALHRSADVEATAVRVSACDGFVRLEGLVDSCAGRARLKQAAWSAPGVRYVEDHVEIGRAVFVGATGSTPRRARRSGRRSPRCGCKGSAAPGGG